MVPGARLATLFELTEAARPAGLDDSWLELWAGSRGLANLDAARDLLQVESTNAPARLLYAVARFVPHHDYPYRIR